MRGGYSKRNIPPVFQVFDDKLSGGKLTEVQDCDDGTFTIVVHFPETANNKRISMEMMDQEAWQYEEDGSLTIHMNFCVVFAPIKEDMINYILSGFDERCCSENFKEAHEFYKSWFNVIIDGRQANNIRRSEK